MDRETQSKILELTRSCNVLFNKLNDAYQSKETIKNKMNALLNQIDGEIDTIKANHKNLLLKIEELQKSSEIQTEVSTGFFDDVQSSDDEE